MVQCPECGRFHESRYSVCIPCLEVWINLFAEASLDLEEGDSWVFTVNESEAAAVAPRN